MKEEIDFINQERILSLLSELDGQLRSLVSGEESVNTPIIGKVDIKCKSFVLIVDGDAIAYTFHNNELKGIFSSLIPNFRYFLVPNSSHFYQDRYLL